MLAQALRQILAPPRRGARLAFVFEMQSPTILGSVFGDAGTEIHALPCPNSCAQVLSPKLCMSEDQLPKPSPSPASHNIHQNGMKIVPPDTAPVEIYHYL